MVERQFKQVAQSMGSDALAYRFWWSGRSGVWLSYSTISLFGISSDPR
jgi:hypothetical protein